MNKITTGRLKIGLGLSCLGLLTLSQPTLAHHSFAMFDVSKDVKLKGKVLAFQWTNPHIWIELQVMEKGKAVQYSIEGGSPNNLSRNGWNRATIRAGETIVVGMHPLRNLSTKGGSFVSATRADGSPVVVGWSGPLTGPK